MHGSYFIAVDDNDYNGLEDTVDFVINELTLDENNWFFPLSIVNRNNEMWVADYPEGGLSLKRKWRRIKPDEFEERPPFDVAWHQAAMATIYSSDVSPIPPFIFGEVKEPLKTEIERLEKMSVAELREQFCKYVDDYIVKLYDDRNEIAERIRRNVDESRTDDLSYRASRLYRAAQVLDARYFPFVASDFSPYNHRAFDLSSEEPQTIVVLDIHT